MTTTERNQPLSWKDLTTDDAIQVVYADQGVCVLLAKTRSCAVCKTIEPRLEHALSKHPDVSRYRVYLEDHEAFRGQHLIFSVPTVLIIKDGVELTRQSRFIDIQALSRQLGACT